MRLSLREIHLCLGLGQPSEDVASVYATSVGTDSRKILPGALFVCIQGERTDGHEHAGSAVEKGATLVLAAHPLRDMPVPVIVVDDTIKALGRLASLWRRKTRARVVGVTGTAGKTTLKESLAQILAIHGKTARNAMNFNNQIGMPSTILNTDGDEDFWVLEAGISHDGDMDELAPILFPDVGLILNIGQGHTAGLGDKGVAWHKSRLLTHLAPGGTGLVCADYPDLVREAVALGVPVRYFSTQDGHAEFYGMWLGQEGSMGRYALSIEGHRFEVQAPFGGAYGAENCIAAAAAAHLLGLTPDEIIQGLGKTVLPPQRFCRKRCGAWDVIDDSYNANPLSMRRMLEAVAAQTDKSDLVLILGEMGELGQGSATIHTELGRYLADLRPLAIFWAGGQADHVAQGLSEGGYTGLWRPVDSAADLVRAWQRDMSDKEAGLILFKGSRSNGLEAYLEELRKLLI